MESGATRAIAAQATFPDLDATVNGTLVEIAGISPAQTIDVGTTNFGVDRSLADGETFVIDDGVNPPLVFEINDQQFPVQPGNLSVDLPANATPDQTTSAILAAIQSELANLDGLTPFKPNEHTVTLAFTTSDRMRLWSGGSINSIDSARIR